MKKELIVHILLLKIDNSIESIIDLKALPKCRQLKIQKLSDYELNQSVSLGYLIKEHLHLNEDVDICYGASGKPELKNTNKHISFSHGGDYVVVAESTQPIGVDIEAIQSVDFTIARRYFSYEEQEEIRTCSDKELAFLTIWTQKESLLKVDGRGFTVDWSELNLLKKRWKTQTIIIPGHVLSCACTVPFSVELQYVKLK